MWSSLQIRSKVFSALTVGILSVGLLVQGCTSQSSISKKSHHGSGSSLYDDENSSSDSPPTSSASGQISAATSGPAFVAAQLQQEVSAPLNASPTYALQSADLSLLQSEGLLSAEDLAELQILVAQP